MSRQGSGAGRGGNGRANDAAYADHDAYQRDAYLEADAYPVDPGYQAYASGGDRERPRPADMPPGPPRTRAERGGMPPRPGGGRRTGWQASYTPGPDDRPWQRPEDAMPGVGRPRPRPAGARPRPAGPGPGQQRTGPGQQRPPQPRGPRPGPYDQDGPGPYGYDPGPAAGQPGQGYPGQGQPGYPGPGNPGQGNPPQGHRGYQQPQGYQGQGFRGRTPDRPTTVDSPVPGWPPPGPNGPAPGFPPGQQWAGPGQFTAPGQSAAEQPWAGQYGTVWSGSAQEPPTGQSGAPGPGQPWPQGQQGYGQRDPGPGPAGYQQGQFTAGQQGPGQPGPAPYPPAGTAPYGHGQPASVPYGQAPYGTEVPGASQYGAGQYAAPPAGTQYGQNMRTTGSWQAAGPQPGQGQGWAPGQAPGGMRGTGSWQAAGAAQGQDWGGQQAPYGPGVRSTGSWQAAGPGFEADPRAAGPWPGQGPGQGQGRAPGPAGGAPGNRGTGSWQAAGPAPGQGWAGTGQQPYPGQPSYGEPHPGQQYQGAADGAGMRNTGGFSRVGSPLIRQRDSALPDPQADAKGPIAAIETDNVAAFARDLRVLRSKVGLDYPDMAEKSHYTMRTLASAAGGLRLPTLPVLIAYVNACGGDVGNWEERWGRLSKAGKRPATALPPGDEQPGAQPGQPRIPHDARQTGEIYVITSAKQRDAHW